MAGLKGRLPKETFSELLKLTGNVDPENNESLILVEDGDGNALPLRISPSKIEIGGVLWPESLHDDLGTVLMLGPNGTSRWAPVMHGYEKFQAAAVSSGVATLPEPSASTNYLVSGVTGAVRINLPAIPTTKEGSLISISVRLNQTGTATITWATPDGKTVNLADDGYELSGVGLPTVFCFTHYVGTTDWLGGIIWAKSVV